MSTHFLIKEYTLALLEHRTVNNEPRTVAAIAEHIEKALYADPKDIRRAFESLETMEQIHFQLVHYGDRVPVAIISLVKEVQQ